MRDLVPVARRLLLAVLLGAGEIGGRSHGQAVLFQHVELHDKVGGVNVVGMHAQAGDGARRVGNVGDGVGAVRHVGFVLGHEQALVPRVGRVGFPVLEALGDRPDRNGRVGARVVVEAQVLDRVERRERLAIALRRRRAVGRRIMVLPGG